MLYFKSEIIKSFPMALSRMQSLLFRGMLTMLLTVRTACIPPTFRGVQRGCLVHGGGACNCYSSYCQVKRHCCLQTRREARVGRMVYTQVELQSLVHIKRAPNQWLPSPQLSLGQVDNCTDYGRCCFLVAVTNKRN